VLQNSNLFELDHPLVRCHMSVLRDVNTTSEQFRNQIFRLATFLAIEATRDLVTDSVEVRTPIKSTAGFALKNTVALVPILRAGLGLIDPIIGMLPQAQVWHLGMHRDEKTAEPIEYYCKLPIDHAADIAIVLDPMLATGGSVRAAITTLKRWGTKDIRVASVLAAPEGIQAVQEEFPDVKIFVCKVDERLDERKFIVPGLGDAGDRIFNTER
jgi:uracil phosphoribosyltransferase